MRDTIKMRDVVIDT